MLPSFLRLPVKRKTKLIPLLPNPLFHERKQENFKDGKCIFRPCTRIPRNFFFPKEKETSKKCRVTYYVPAFLLRKKILLALCNQPSRWCRLQRPKLEKLVAFSRKLYGCLHVTGRPFVRTSVLAASSRSIYIS